MLAPYALKASATHDPDTPCLHEAIGGEHREKFLIAMGKEIAELEELNTWTVVQKSSFAKRSKPPSVHLGLQAQTIS